MNHSMIAHFLLSASFVVGSVIAAGAQEISTSQLLDRAGRCDHVIDLIRRHGVNNSVDRSASRSILHHSRLGVMEVPESELGDLEVVQVNRIAHEDASCGPKFAVVVRNQSSRKVCNLHVSAVAILGRIFASSPNATIKVQQIDPGQAVEVLLPLPIEAFAMGNRDGQVIGFQKLVVAIDSLDQFAETNEANNVKAFETTQIPVLTIPIEPTAEPLSNGPSETAVVQTPHSDNSNQLDRPTTDPLRSAIEKLGVGEAQ